MGRPPFQKLRPGERLPSIPATAWNGFIDAALDFQARQNDRTSRAFQALTSPGIVPVKNDSGSDCDRFHVLSPTGVLFTPSDNLQEWKNAPVLKGTTPASSDLRKFVILQEPIPNGKIGAGLLAGISPVKIDVKHADDEFADIIPSDRAKLRSQPFGACQILYKESGTGEKWAYVLHGLPGSQILVGKTNTAINKGTGPTNGVNVYRGATKGSESFVSGDTITAWNYFRNVASGKWVLCVYYQGGWALIAAEC